MARVFALWGFMLNTKSFDLFLIVAKKSEYEFYSSN